jgi:uncharacterized membrane protein
MTTRGLLAHPVTETDSRVAPVGKLSVVFAIALAALVLGERPR